MITAVLPLLLGCGGNGTGGKPGSGGAPGSGGMPGSGGTSSSGGAPGSGGTSSSGGVTGSGGLAPPGSGGATASSGGIPGSGGGGAGTGGAGSGGAANAPPFELAGKWTYLGPSDVPHDLTINQGSMLYEDVEGQWSSKWTITSYDNVLHHFQVTFDSSSGSYLPVGQSMSGTYDRGVAFLTIQLAKGSSYPPLEGAGSCTGTDGTLIPECRLYTMPN